MSGQLKAFQKSFLIHMVAVVAVVGFAGSARQFSKPLVIDFTIENQAVCDLNADTKKDTPPLPTKQAEPVKNIQSPPQVPLPSAVSEAQVPVIAPKATPVATPVADICRPAVAKDIDYSTAQHAIAPVYRQAVSSGPPDGAGAAASTETMKARYLKENFTYIRELIQKRVAYPAAARRLGWEGRVTVAFIVSANGSIKELKVADSSGKKMLDDGAVEAVRKAAPFPPPPVEAVLLIPVTYKLN